MNTARPEGKNGIHEMSEGNQEIVTQSIEVCHLETEEGESTKAALGPNNRYFSLTEESDEKEDLRKRMSMRASGHTLATSVEVTWSAVWVAKRIFKAPALRRLHQKAFPPWNKSGGYI